ncbi:cytochrome c biogenesis protein CcdA [Collinsella sp. BA40]|uniref:cytochrome c biogenesis CcdA family protein n=1 Tax=Collinsella sp. BA40 TaxID=2560852 RepID=UPI0011C7119C|nr:cytochrome c biogenesis CcdA family protein [Collinsella sp. BA40]TXF35127.1 cytochrome c biogenesis protein CcdA [Collinsella sp. BA40]
MPYVAAFLEGIITFISPCLLPMLPVYIAYFAGDSTRGSGATARNALGFILGFTLVFVTMGALAGSIGGLLREYQTVVNVVCGSVVIVLGLNFLGVIKLGLFHGARRAAAVRDLGFFSALALGAVFSLGWTPCVGAFLGSALMLAGQQGHVIEGMLMLLAYSAGLGIPFFASALLIDQFKGAFDVIKRHYDAITKASGALLIAMGVLMATGAMTGLVGALS